MIHLPYAQFVSYLPPSLLVQKKTRKKKVKEEDTETEMEENGDDELTTKRPTKKGKSSTKKKGAESQKALGKGIKASSQPEKPRIKIRMSNEKKTDNSIKSKKTKSRAGKRKRSPELVDNEDEEVDESADADVESTPIPRKKRSKKDNSTSTSAPTLIIRKRGTQKQQSADGVAQDDDSSSIFLDPLVWKGERESLDGSFAAAWKFFTKRGPWKIPPEIADKFRDVALATLSKMDRFVNSHTEADVDPLIFRMLIPPFLYSFISSITKGMIALASFLKP